MNLKITILSFFLLLSGIVSAQSFNYSYTDPCNGNVYNLTIPYGQDQIAVTYYGQVNTFTANDFNNGAFDQWAANVFNQFQNASPCGGIGTTVTISQTQSTALNIVGIFNSLSAISDMASSGSGNIMGAANSINNVGGGSGSGNKGGNKNSQNQGGNGSGNNSTGQNNSSGDKQGQTAHPKDKVSLVVGNLDRIVPHKDKTVPQAVQIKHLALPVMGVVDQRMAVVRKIKINLMGTILQEPVHLILVLEIITVAVILRKVIIRQPKILVTLADLMKQVERVTPTAVAVLLIVQVVPPQAVQGLVDLVVMGQQIITRHKLPKKKIGCRRWYD